VTEGAINQDRWHEAWAEDLDVLRNLRADGDIPSIPREIDVSFRGSLGALRQLSAACGTYGFRVQELIEADEDGDPWLFLVRTQTTDNEAMEDLTTTYLRIEATFGVRCDGWGCMAEDGTV
jgi:regulator of ribonuclease activity B